MNESMLSSIRVLDLTDEKGWACGRVLADLGAEVIKVEKPGGDDGRMLGPFYHDQQQPEKSLYWMAYNAGKKSVTLDLGNPKGIEIFKHLVQTSQFVVESFVPGHLDNLGIGYESLNHVNPAIILASISPFGQTSSWKSRAASDLTLWALSSVMASTGDQEREPLKLYLDQSYVLAGLHAVVGLLAAHYNQALHGIGQHVDVSILHALTRLQHKGTPLWEWHKLLIPRVPWAQDRGKNIVSRIIWPCRDGYVSWFLTGGQAGLQENLTMLRWISEENVPIEGFEKLLILDKEVDFAKFNQEDLHELEEIIEKFFLRHHKMYLQEEGLKREVALAAVHEIAEVREDRHLASRDFWVKIPYEQLGGEITYPGRLFLSDQTYNGVRGRAPLIGEHNAEIYTELLKISEKEIKNLELNKVI